MRFAFGGFYQILIPYLLCTNAKRKLNECLLPSGERNNLWSARVVKTASWMMKRPSVP